MLGIDASNSSEGNGTLEGSEMIGMSALGVCESFELVIVLL